MLNKIVDLLPSGLSEQSNFSVVRNIETQFKNAEIVEVCNINSSAKISTCIDFSKKQKAVFNTY